MTADNWFTDFNRLGKYIYLVYNNRPITDPCGANGFRGNHVDIVPHTHCDLTFKYAYTGVYFLFCNRVLISLLLQICI